MSLPILTVGELTQLLGQLDPDLPVCVWTEGWDWVEAARPEVEDGEWYHFPKTPEGRSIATIHHGRFVKL